MKKTLFIGLAVMLFAVGCATEEAAPTPEPMETSPSVSTPSPLPAVSPTPASTTVSTSSPAPASEPSHEATPAPTSTLAPTPAALFLQVSQPEDGSVLDTESVRLVGTTIPGAVVSISLNGEIGLADVDDGGHFGAILVLSEGPNYIEVVASDLVGSQVYTTLAVVYSP